MCQLLQLRHASRLVHRRREELADTLGNAEVPFYDNFVTTKARGLIGRSPLASLRFLEPVSFVSLKL